MKPLIGITSSIHYDRNNWEYLRAYSKNARAIEQAGGIPVLVPCLLEEETLRELYERLDGVLLPGGGDVDPAFYGMEVQATIKAVSAIRDQAEISLSRWAVDDGLPVFGICRGHQVFNVALGGTLVQDIPTQLHTEIVHDISDGTPRSTRLHDVTVNADSLLARVLSGERFDVNSIHHQSIQQMAPGLRATAYAPDGVIEATELPDHPYALTVQWHPEDMVDDDAVMFALFRSFVEAAAARRA